MCTHARAHCSRPFPHMNVPLSAGGVGIASIAACRSTQLTHVLLTDGNCGAIVIAQQNLQNAGLCDRASAQTYTWGDPRPQVQVLPDVTAAGRTAGPESGPGPELDFDVLLGSELCYYNTDMALLVATAQRLLSRRHGQEGEEAGGIFVHAHIFRKADQEEEMIQCFEDIHWATAEVREPCLADYGI